MSEEEPYGGTEKVIETMLNRISLAEEQNRTPHHFLAAPDIYGMLKKEGFSLFPHAGLKVETVPGAGTRISVSGVPVMFFEVWSWGWMLFDSNRRPVEVSSEGTGTN
jgi:hypothetical protein